MSPRTSRLPSLCTLALAAVILVPANLLSAQAASYTHIAQRAPYQNGNAIRLPFAAEAGWQARCCSQTFPCFLGCLGTWAPGAASRSTSVRALLSLAKQGHVCFARPFNPDRMSAWSVHIA